MRLGRRLSLQEWLASRILVVPFGLASVRSWPEADVSTAGRWNDTSRLVVRRQRGRVRRLTLVSSRSWQRCPPATPRGHRSGVVQMMLGSGAHVFARRTQRMTGLAVPSTQGAVVWRTSIFGHPDGWFGYRLPHVEVERQVAQR